MTETTSAPTQLSAASSSTESAPTAASSSTESAPTVWSFPLPNGLKCYSGEYPDAIEAARRDGEEIYYYLGVLTGTTGHGTMTSRTFRPRLFRVTSTFMGAAVVHVDEDEYFGVDPISDIGEFFLPPIPYELIHDIDAFFRLAHSRHGTESILLLTFDPQYLDKEKEAEQAGGWGVVVPEQWNTGSHCRYDNESIVDDKPDHVHIVGSAHSHPNMSAFASHTDIGDQAQFDGLHITFGWMGHKNQGATEFHAELQLGGGRFDQSLETIFTQLPPAPEVSERVEAWADKVHKAVVTDPKALTSTTSGESRTSAGGTAIKDLLPKDCPDPQSSGNTVIAKLIKGETTCPGCGSDLNAEMLRRHRCHWCMLFLVPEHESLRDLDQARAAQGFSVVEFDLENETFGDLVYWYRFQGETGFQERLEWLRGERPPKA